MSKTNYRTWIYGELVTVSMMNEQIRDNGNAIWVGTTAGDMDYYTGATGKARILIGSEGQSLIVASGIPGWGGTIKDIDIVDVSPEQTFSNAAWADITGATLTLALPCTCTVLILAVVTGYVMADLAGYGFSVRGLIDGTADADNNYNGSANPKRNEAFPYFWFKTGIAAGNRIAKLQCQQKIQNLYVARARLIALAFAE